MIGLLNSCLPKVQFKLANQNRGKSMLYLEDPHHHCKLIQIQGKESYFLFTHSYRILKSHLSLRELVLGTKDNVVWSSRIVDSIVKLYSVHSRRHNYNTGLFQGILFTDKNMLTLHTGNLYWISFSIQIPKMREYQICSPFACHKSGLFH